MSLDDEFRALQRRMGEQGKTVVFESLLVSLEKHLEREVHFFNSYRPYHPHKEQAQYLLNALRAHFDGALISFDGPAREKATP